MRIFFLIIFMSSIFFTAAPAKAAGPLKMKFVQSVYDDGKETGLNHPEGVACTDEYFIVADTGNNRLLRYTFTGKDAKAVEPELPVIAPFVVQLNSKGEIFAIDGKDRRIKIFNPDGSEKGNLSPKGSPVSRKLVPRSFTIDQKDQIYILDISDNVVLILDADGTYLRHIPLPEDAGFCSDLAVDGQGTVFLVDSTKIGVYASAPEAGEFSPLSGDTKEYANFPTNIAIDKNGIIYLVDKHGGNLLILNRDGSFLGHKFGYGWKESQFYYPSQMCISPKGNIFIADRGNSRVQLFISEE